MRNGFLSAPLYLNLDKFVKRKDCFRIFPSIYDFIIKRADLLLYIKAKHLLIHSLKIFNTYPTFYIITILIYLTLINTYLIFKISFNI